MLLCVWSVTSVMSDSSQPHGLWPARLLCPWNFSGENTGVGSHSLLQGNFPARGSNPCLLHCRQILYHWATREANSPNKLRQVSKSISFADSAGTLKGIYIVTLPSPGVVENLSFKTVSSLSHPSFLLQSILPLFPFATVSAFCERSSHYTPCSQQYPCSASLCCPPQFTNSCYCKWQPSCTIKLASALPAFNNHFISKCTTHHFCNSFATRYLLFFFLSFLFSPTR